MEEILKRLRQVRGYLGLKQGEFSKGLKIPQNSYSQIETGVNPIKDRHIALICLTFGINETWLRTGKGEMLSFSPDNPPPSSIAGNDGERLTDEEGKFIDIYRKLAPSNREVARTTVDALLKAQGGEHVDEKPEKTPPNSPDDARGPGEKGENPGRRADTTESPGSPDSG
jgi:transcriptional regulator with XRE-family HTH domain